MSDLYQKLRDAVLKNDYDVVEKLLLKGVNINASDDSGETVLHIAMRIGAATNVMQLLDAGADPNQPDDEGVTPFMAAVNAEKYANATFAIDYKADVHFQPTPQSLPALYRAIFYDTINGTSKRTSFLLERGANIDAVIVLPDGSEQTVGEYALKCESEAGGDRFTKLVENYLGRNLRQEFSQAAARKREHATIASVISTRAHADGAKFKMGRP